MFILIVDRWQDRKERSMKQKYFKMLKKDGMRKQAFKNKGAGENPNLEPLGQRKQEAERRLGQVEDVQQSTEGQNHNQRQK